MHINKTEYEILTDLINESYCGVKCERLLMKLRSLYLNFGCAAPDSELQEAFNKMMLDSVVALAEYDYYDTEANEAR